MDQWLLREFNEEIKSEEIESIDFNGIINDDSEALGGINKVHFGLLFTVNIHGDAQIKEKEKFEDGKMLSLEQLRSMKNTNWETWSDIVLKEYLLKKSS